MKITQIVLPAILYLLPMELSAQLMYSSTTIEDLSFLLGTWEGELEYLNYHDLSVSDRIPVSWEFRRVKNKIVYVWNFTRPDGLPGRQKSHIEFKNGLLYFGDGYYELKEKRTSRSANNQEWVFYRRAKEGKEKLMIKQTLIQKDKTLILKKEIQPQGEFEFVPVTIYRMERK
ncbi:MAG: hypothetical protein R3D00_19740 [Bacteroidia bacterium]